MTVRWFETHTHLSDSQFDADRDAAIERAFSVGVERIIEIADGPAEWEKARNLAERYPGRLYWAAGFHPYYADQATTALLQQLKDYCSHPQFVAIGEVGLDYAKCTIDHDIQKKTFRAALDLHFETGKPLVIHSRDAMDDLVTILRERFISAPAVSPGVIHCFSGNAQHVSAIAPLGFYFGVDGPVTYPNANELRATLKDIPLDRLVVETDSPYLPPQGFRGKRNEPSYLPLIGSKLAEVLGVQSTEFAHQLWQNSGKLFRIE